MINVVPGEWERIQVNDDGTQVEYKIDRDYGGAAKIEIDARTGVGDQEQTYYGTGTETATASYRLVFEGAGIYTFVMNNDGTRMEYKLELLQSGTVEIEVETTAPLSYEKDVKSYGTWTKTADNMYATAVPNEPGYIMTLSSNSAASLSTPDNGEVRLVRDY